MATAVYTLGCMAGASLILLLVLTLLKPAARIWPTPGEKTVESYMFWPLFRGLNVLCVAMAILDRGTPNLIELPPVVRGLAWAALAASVALFLYAFFRLGRDNSYGAQDGLVTGGIYQWSRNPQNAMLVVVYGCLAVAADGWRVTLLSAMMMAVYVLMVLCEEPWLEGVYGDAYRKYCRAVPRFFHWRKLFGTVRT